MSDSRNLYVVVKLGGNEIGIPVHQVWEMVMLPKVSAMPLSLPYARGIITLRGNAIPLIDLRRFFGLAALEEEQADLLQILTVREEDHVNWLQELENSVKEKRPFKLATDPHKCNFGKWYDNYTTDYLLMQALLPKFDAPHKRIHGIAQEVVALGERGEHDAAMAIIEQTRSGDLATMIRLFGQARDILREDQRELALVLRIGGRALAVSVDSVAAVESLVRSEDGGDLSMLDGVGELMDGIAQSDSGDRLILLFDPERTMAPHTEMLAAG